MKIKKRYIFACILLCIAALAVCVVVFNLEMGMARFSKLNKVTSEKWVQTLDYDPDYRERTSMRITSVNDVDGEQEFKYIGKQCYAGGKYIAYGKDVFGGTVLLNGKNPATGEEYKVGDTVAVFYKPDNPRKMYAYTSITPYLVPVIILFVAAIVLVIVCRIINKSMKDNTFSESAVTIMDIPTMVIVVGFILSFFAGMVIGNIQVDASYTAISEGVVKMLESGELTF